MAKEFARKFYNSTRWRKCAKAFAQSKLYICEMCHNKTVARKGTDGQRFFSEIFTGKEMILCRDIAKKH